MNNNKTTTNDFDAQEQRARAALVAVQADIDRAALAIDMAQLASLEAEHAELTTQIARIGAARRGAAAKAKEDATIDRAGAASKAGDAVKKLAIARAVGILKIGSAIESLRTAAVEVDAIDAELRAKMLAAVRSNVSDTELRQRLAVGRCVGGETVTPILALLHAATRADIFQRRVEVGGFTSPAPDLSKAAARDTELTAGWLDALGRYRAIEEDARND